ncbi:hypothetical protein BLA17378_04474 [Burkholderia aenigmatica]|uniref:Uncharacterized protein n=2 Tax=Burkholderia aenigmatica TaxID=2015348 RepID=A0ABY6XVG3_9BURK|nr:hypothetical protein BLA17378_04474 [Burkholderia aenigmatica]
MQESLFKAIMGHEGEIYNEETKKDLLDTVIAFFPPTPPINFVESAYINDGKMHIKFTAEATELLRQQGWEEMDAQREAG